MRSDTRNTIIHTASELFYRKGYNLTGINEIIEKSGIAKATLYSHFKSKEDLLITYLNEKDQELMNNLEAFCKAKPVGDARLLGVLEFLIPFFKMEDFNGCWCIRTVAEVPIENQRVRSQIRKNKNQLRQFILKLVENNKLDLTKEAQQQLSDRLFLLYEGALTESHIQEEAWPIETAISLFKDVLKKM